MSVGQKQGGAGRLLLRLLVLVGLISITGLLISRFDIRSADDNYIAAVLEKDRLIRNTPSPKVILVGGSNLAFGVDSRMLRDSLGLSVVNMGLYAKLGIKYMLAQVEPYIARNDVVVIVPEYDQFFGDYANGDNTLNTALLYTPNDRIPDFIRSYSIVDVIWKPRVENARRSFLHALAAAVGREKQFFPPDTNPVYNRHSFNEYGDVVSHQNRKGKDPDSIFVSHLPPMKEFNRHTLDYLNSIENKAQKVGAHAYFMYPSYIDSSYTINAGEIDSLGKKLRRGMRMPIIGSPRDFAYPKTSFFDTRYHLNWNARPRRTRDMIELLRATGKRDGWLPQRIGGGQGDSVSSSPRLR